MTDGSIEGRYMIEAGRSYRDEHGAEALRPDFAHSRAECVSGIGWLVTLADRAGVIARMLRRPNGTWVAA